ncbi:MAG: uncharacterized membrane protein YgdD (TMEM256/DUF423 family) [Paraglaciecola sp.]|jgi:uncharacterized membrane protein YgdD (TMEM256/DUF423 family)
MKFFLALGAFSAMLAVILGAFAAHGLKDKLTESLMSAFQTGVHYQLYHSLAIILTVILYRQTPAPMFLWSASFMLGGILLFSGSLYLLALSGIKWIGPITPLGGLCFIVGWGLLLVASLKGSN